MDPHVPVYQLIVSMKAYGRYLAGRGDIIKGSGILLDALALSAKYYGIPDLGGMPSLAFYISDIDPILANDILSDALSISKHIYGAKSFNSASLLFSIATRKESNITKGGDVDNVEKLYLEYLDIIGFSCGENSNIYNSAMQTLAKFYNKYDKKKAKELLSNINVDKTDKAFNSDQRGIIEITSLEEQANTIMEVRGDYLQALDIYERTTAAKKELLGKDDIRYKSSLTILAWLYVTTGKYQKAIEIPLAIIPEFLYLSFYSS